MKLAACVLTYNAISTGRVELLEQTIASLAESDHPIYVVDNHSTDGTAELVANLGGHCSQDLNTTCGHGTNLCARVLAATEVDICVLSDDDMLWHPGWAEQLTAWWGEAPGDVWLTGCHLEPLFPWNEVVGRLTCGGVVGLLRASTGAASWSFRREQWPLIGPIPERRQGHGDVPACERVHRSGGRIAQLDLADHVGAVSSWGNRTIELYGWDLDPVRALLGETA